MDCKLLLLLGNYHSYLEFFDSQHALNEVSYEEHYNKFIADCCGWNGAWVEPFQELGFCVNEIFYNNSKLQEKWTKQFLTDQLNLDPMEIVFEQIRKYKPEVLFIDNIQVFDSAVIREIRSRFSFIKKIVSYIGTNHFNNHSLNDYDLIFCPVETYRKPISDLGVRVELLPHAFNPKVLDHISENQNVPKSKIMFAGGIVLGNDMHNDRLDYIRHIIANVPIDIFSDVGNSSFAKEMAVGVLKKAIHESFILLQKLGVKKDQLEHLPKVGHFAKWDNYNIKFIGNHIKRVCHNPKFGIELFRETRNYIAVFNMHIAQVNEAANMRLYEVTGVGGCLLTDAKYNLSEIFELDSEVVSFSSKEECVEKAKWLIEHPQQSVIIGENAQKRVLKDHTFFNRSHLFDESLQKLF